MGGKSKINQCNLLQLVEAKTTYFTNKVEESKDDPKALF